MFAKWTGGFRRPLHHRRILATPYIWLKSKLRRGFRGRASERVAPCEWSGGIHSPSASRRGCEIPSRWVDANSEAGSIPGRGSFGKEIFKKCLSLFPARGSTELLPCAVSRSPVPYPSRDSSARYRPRHLSTGYLSAFLAIFDTIAALKSIPSALLRLSR